MTITRPDDFENLFNAYRGRMGVDPEGEHPPYDVGDILHYATDNEGKGTDCCYGQCKGPLAGDENIDEMVVWLCVFDTSDKDWLTLVSSSVANHAETLYNYENKHRPPSNTRFRKVGSILPPITVPPLSTPEEAVAFLDSLHETTHATFH